MMGVTDVSQEIYKGQSESLCGRNITPPPPAPPPPPPPVFVVSSLCASFFFISLHPVSWQLPTDWHRRTHAVTFWSSLRLVSIFLCGCHQRNAVKHLRKYKHKCDGSVVTLLLQPIHIGEWWPIKRIFGRYIYICIYLLCCAYVTIRTWLYWDAYYTVKRLNAGFCFSFTSTKLSIDATRIISIKGYRWPCI